MISTRRAACRTLAVLLTYAILHPSFAAAVDIQTRSRAVTLPVAPLAASRGPALAPTAQLGAAVDAHPVIGVLNQLQAQKIALPEALSTHADVVQAREAAAALPDGAARQGILAMAEAAHASLAGGAADGGKLDAAYDNVPTPKTGVLARLSSSPWVPASVARLLSPSRNAAAIDPATRQIPIERLRWAADLGMIPQEGTARVEVNDKQIVGQDTALKAIYFGLKMPSENYNLFVGGADGSGRATAVRHVAEQLAATMPVPLDKVAVTNVVDAKKPVILSLPTGSAVRFEKAMKQFVAAYGLMLPQALKSPKIREMQKLIKQQYEDVVKQRQEAFDAEVDKVALPGGKFALKIVVVPTENGVRVLPALRYKDASGAFVTPESEEQVEKAIADGLFTKAEMEKAAKDGEAAAKPFYDQFRAMVEENQNDQQTMEKSLDEITGKVAGSIVEQLKMGLIASLQKNTHDDDAHKAFAQRAGQRIKDLSIEASKAKLGQYGVALAQTEGGFMLVLTRQEEGKAVAMMGEEIQAKLASGELTEAAVDRVLAPLMQKLQEIGALNAKEHKALHADDAPPTAEEKAAIEYIDKLAAHAVEHHDSFLPPDPSAGQAALMERMRNDGADLYRVSVLVDNAKQAGAPVIFDDEPSLQTSFGKIETHTKGIMMGGGKTMQFESPAGPELEAGLFQKADGGFYVVDVMKALQAPGYWQTLMKAVSSGKADIIGVNQQQGEIVRYGVPSRVKIVLIGSPMIKMLLAEHDQSFAKAFRASADFEPTLSIGQRAIEGYLQFMKNVIAKSKGELPEFARDGVAAVLGEAARMADSNEKLTAQFGRVYSLMQRAAFWAREAGAKIVSREHVSAAIQAQKDFTQGGERRLLEAYKNGSMAISTTGRAVGQINGLAVMGSMGVPMQITVESGRGESGIKLWDKDAGFTGQLFNKALGVVDGFFLRMLGQYEPVKVKIAMSYEQQYGGIDGDSATSTEAYVILSALSGIPLRQDLAVTGSMNQKGRVQAIGGANEKTEGFFKVSGALATDAQKMGFNGVLMPATNEKNLQLDPAVVQAVREGKFQVYSIRTVKEGWEILTGVPFEEAIRLARRNSGR
jgi:lon-related putative ATP-dependent protease